MTSSPVVCGPSSFVGASALTIEPSLGPVSAARRSASARTSSGYAVELAAHEDRLAQVESLAVQLPVGAEERIAGLHHGTS